MLSLTNIKIIGSTISSMSNSRKGDGMPMSFIVPAIIALVILLIYAIWMIANGDLCDIAKGFC